MMTESPNHRAKFSAALFASCTGLVSSRSLGASWRISRGACCAHSIAEGSIFCASSPVTAMPPISTITAPRKRGTYSRRSTRMIGLPTRAKNIASSTGSSRSCAAHSV